MAMHFGKLLTGFILAVAGLLVILLFITLRAPAPGPAPMPNPNGYDELVKAGQMLGEQPVDYSKLGREELEAVLLKKAEGLKFGRAALGHESRVPMDNDPASTARISRLSWLKRLAQAWAGEGRLAELQNRPAAAAESYLNIVRLGHAVAQGGTIIDALVGVACEAMGVTGLEKLAGQLNAGDCRAVTTALESAESGRQSVAAVFEQERQHTRRTYGLRGEIYRLANYRSRRISEQKLAQRLNGQQNRTGAFLIRLASRAYELDKGEAPKTVTELVPTYLKRVPVK